MKLNYTYSVTVSVSEKTLASPGGWRTIHFSHLPTAKRFPHDYHVRLYGTDGFLNLQFSEEENNSPACGCKAAAATVIGV
jgi:hypothetical protein